MNCDLDIRQASTSGGKVVNMVIINLTFEGGGGGGGGREAQANMEETDRERLP